MSTHKISFRPTLEALEDRSVPTFVFGFLRHLSYISAPPQLPLSSFFFRPQPIPGGVGGLGFNTTVNSGPNVGALGASTTVNSGANVGAIGFNNDTLNAFSNIAFNSVQPAQNTPNPFEAGFDSIFIMGGIGRPFPISLQH